jgi:peptidoglycan biosynthesis protein MviN/MurJ (putative lipid II flippase)
VKLRRRTKTLSVEERFIAVGVTYVLLSCAVIIWQHFHHGELAGAVGSLAGGLLVIVIGVIMTRTRRR